jgi:hypothetical protein
VPENDEGISIEPIQALLGTKPKKADVILEDCLDSALRKPLLHRQVDEVSGRARRRSACQEED